MPTATHEGQDHQQQQANANGERSESEALDQEVIHHTAGMLAGKLLGNTLFLITFPLVATLFQHLFLADLTIEDNEVHRELLRPSMGVEEVDREDEAGSQERFVRVNNSGYVERPSRQEQTENFGKPEHKSGPADGEHTPEDCDKVEFL